MATLEIANRDVLEMVEPEANPTVAEGRPEMKEPPQSGLRAYTAMAGREFPVVRMALTAIRVLPLPGEVALLATMGMGAEVGLRPPTWST